LKTGDVVVEEKLMSMHNNIQWS